MRVLVCSCQAWRLRRSRPPPKSTSSFLSSSPYHHQGSQLHHQLPGFPPFEASFVRSGAYNHLVRPATTDPPASTPSRLLRITPKSTILRLSSHIHHVAAKGWSQLEIRQVASPAMARSLGPPHKDSLPGLLGRHRSHHPAVARCQQICL